MTTSPDRSSGEAPVPNGSHAKRDPLAARANGFDLRTADEYLVYADFLEERSDPRSQSYRDAVLGLPPHLYF